MTEAGKILLWGGRSQARIIQTMLHERDAEAAFIYDPKIDRPTFPTAAEFSSRREDLLRFIDAATHFVVCIGDKHGMARHRISQKLMERGLQPLSVTSARAMLDRTASTGWGLQAMPGAVLHCHAAVGDACILNANCCVDHESRLGDGVHVMGSAAVAGRVTIGDYASIGTNASILPDITIGKGAFVGAGAVVGKDVGENQIVVGNPARLLKTNNHECDLSDFE